MHILSYCWVAVQVRQVVGVEGFGLPHHCCDHWPHYWLAYCFCCLRLQEFSDRCITVYSSQMWVISQHFVRQVLCYFVINVSEAMFWCCGILIPFLTLLFLLLQLFNIFYITSHITLCSFACHRSGLWIFTKISYFVIILLFSCLFLLSPFLSLLYSFSLSFSPILFFFNLTYFLFQVF